MIGKRANGIGDLKRIVISKFFLKKKRASLKLFPKSKCPKMFGLQHLLEL